MKPIGVFDSGIGGLTVVRALRELLPNENIFYLGDTARVPYGNKSAETVERYSLELARILMAEDAKLIVVACNTVSSVAIPKLRAGVSVPVLGCTHYPLLTRAIVRSLGDKIQIVDSAMNCARAVKDLLDRQSLATTSTSPGKLDVALTDAADHFLSIARDALQLQLGDVQLRAVS